MKTLKNRLFTSENGIRIKKTRFPVSVFWTCIGICTVMSGVHQGVIVAMDKLKLSGILQTHLLLLFWVLVAAGMALYIRRKMKITYELPLQRISKAIRKVAKGDFSVDIPTTNAPDKLDYLDLMILDLNRMIKELGSIETLKTDFISNVSHEIKTPLAVIRSNVELMEMKDRKEKEYSECAANIHQAVDRLTALISNMLRLNKLENQTIHQTPQRYDLCRQLSDCALQFESVWEEKDIEFDADIEDEVFIEADEGLMEIVWNNLLSNALKFTPVGGTVSLVQKRAGNRILVTVADTGCGMIEETMQHIFDKFYQGDRSHSTEGNGLGLALVRRILDISGGAIRVESKENAGSRFVVELRAADRKTETKYGGADK